MKALTLALLFSFALVSGSSRVRATPAPLLTLPLECGQSSGPLPLTPGEYTANFASEREVYTWLLIQMGVNWPSCGGCPNPEVQCSSHAFPSGGVTIGTFYNPVLDRWFGAAEVSAGATYVQVCDPCP